MCIRDRTMKIGFLGCGIMGVPMAKNLINAGHEVTVWNRTSDAAKPVVDAVAYVVKGLAAGNDRDWVVSSDECSTLEMWGAELAALLGFPLGRGFEVRRITDSLVKNRHAVARLADAAHRCRRALALARRLEAAVAHRRQKVAAREHAHLP